ncbi:zinc dependent phospholipase C family protein [Paenibacillus xylaniclasticus]|uniref:zinc dependent phospholipase C family protein n=1 Tax=Paenibacillus xylaniclasticus TaxID=588083 RepID=UPI000FD9519A|nr:MULTISPECIES: zinc dependent phospholipase C family protein [Paenibacillus]GFN30977.1 hypothetical protein PCURB6_12370 [Paenibacillus curdlanolyticus]
MPNVWAHILFGHTIMERLEEQNWLSDDEMTKWFNLGCQGPDFLFYHRFLPWHKSSVMNQLGTEMHNRECGPVLLDLLDSVSGRQTDDEDRYAAAYAIGFVLHHVLDRNMHPYVFSRSGFRKWDHQRFETAMDTIIASRLYGIDTWRTPVWKNIAPARPLPNVLLEAFENIAAVRYPELASEIKREYWQEALRDIASAQRLFFDPTGIRRLLTFGKIEPLSYRRNLPDYDWMNEQELPWLDPTDGKTLYTVSAWTLWEQAIEDGIAVAAAAMRMIRETQSPSNARTATAELVLNRSFELREEVEQLLGDRSYETGLPCSSGAVIRYADPIWPDGGIKRTEADDTANENTG